LVGDEVEGKTRQGGIRGGVKDSGFRLPVIGGLEGIGEKMASNFSHGKFQHRGYDRTKSVKELKEEPPATHKKILIKIRVGERAEKQKSQGAGLKGFEVHPF